MPPFKLFRSKKAKESQKNSTEQLPDNDAGQSQQPTISQVISRDSEDEDGRNRSRRSSYYSFRDSGKIPQGGLISLIPSDLPDDVIKHQLKEDPPSGHVRRVSNVTFSDSDHSDNRSRSLERKAEELTAKLDHVSTRQGAQRRTAMATYRTASYTEYEQRAVVLDSSYNTTTSEPALSTVIGSPEDRRGLIDELSIKDITASQEPYPLKRDESISPLDVNDTANKTFADDINTRSLSATPPTDGENVLSPLPQRAFNDENATSVIAETTADMESDLASAPPVATPIVMSVDRHPGDSPPPSKSQKGPFVHYPAPIPARIRLPPLLKKQSKTSSSSEGPSPDSANAPTISTSFSFPMTAPMEVPEEPDNGHTNEEHSDSDESTVPITPGYRTRFQSPHEALESMLNEWDKEPTALVQPFTPLEELPATDGPRSLIQELEERKTQQKSRQRNAGAVASASLLQLDDVIRKGQEKRRTVVGIHGLVGTAQVRNDEDEIPLGAIYENDPGSQPGDPTRVSEGRRYYHSPGDSFSQRHAMPHNRRTSSSSIPQRSIHDRQMSDSSVHFGPHSQQQREASQSNYINGAPQGAIVPENLNSLNKIRESNMSMPNLHYQLDRPASTNIQPESSPYILHTREMSVPNFDQYRLSYQKYPVPATNAPQYPPHQQPAAAQQQYVPPYQHPPYPGQSPVYDMGTGYFRESVRINSESPIKDTRRYSSLLNSEEALYRRLKERQSIMMGYPPQHPGPRQVSMMTKEGQELLQLKQYYQQQQQQEAHLRQQYYNQPPGLPTQGHPYSGPAIQHSKTRLNIPAALAPSSTVDASDSKKREVVERWRRSVVTGGA
ncbi:hypothetical protein V1525DRAFT_342056 [Lipomyces kononenkoae]|uniref:Uncharacterized protein n=1 Tax=Lipomyces kononenkoae TaxID=34357 RepID=A0ACC3T3Y3_LIPKO